MVAAELLARVRTELPVVEAMGPREQLLAGSAQSAASAEKRPLPGRFAMRTSALIVASVPGVPLAAWVSS